MNFASTDFWKALLIFFCVVAVSRILVRSDRVRDRLDPVLLAAGSLTFFGLESVLSLAILLAVFFVSALGTFGVSRLRNQSARVAVFVVCTILMLASVVVF